MLEKMRHAAAEQAKHAADVAGEQARRAAAAAQHATVTATDRAGEAAARGLDRAVEAAKDPANQARAKVAARQAASATAKGAAKGAGTVATGAGKAVKSALDKLNPELLASVVMKATALQEQANASLKKNGSLYRISGIAIGAAFPPSVTFQIGRLSDVSRDEMMEQPENAFLEAPDVAAIATSDGAG